MLVVATTVASIMLAAAPAPADRTPRDPCQQAAQMRKEQAAIDREIAEARHRLEQLEARGAAIAIRLAQCAQHTDGKAASRCPVSKRRDRVAAEQLAAAVAGLMHGKGLLVDDLPPVLQGHPTQLRTAIESHDHQSAIDYGSQLCTVVDGIAIDRAFTEQKMQRLSRWMREQPAAAPEVAEVTQRFERLTRLFTDGKYQAANAEINEIRRLLDRSAQQKEAASERREVVLPPPPE